MRTIYLPLCIATLILCGCDKDSQSRNAKEERDPLIKQGQAYMDIKDWNQAEIAFKQALENNPTMARPHLDLARIYQQYKANYIHAIYHYDRYLELQPDAEKTEFIREQRKLVEQALSNGYINGSKEVRDVVVARNALQKENALLKRELIAAQAPASTKAVVTPPKSVTKTIPKSAPPQKASKPIIYTVVENDTLTKIAQKFYKNNNYDPIYEANRDRMKSPGDLRIGQTLVIPISK